MNFQKKMLILIVKNIFLNQKCTKNSKDDLDFIQIMNLVFYLKKRLVNFYFLKEKQI